MTAICRLAPIIDAPTTGEKRIGGNHNLDEAVIAGLCLGDPVLPV